jgi:hypothetical protein
MTGSALPRLAKILFAQLQQVGESHIRWCAPDCFEDLHRSRRSRHGITIGTILAALTLYGQQF